MQFAEEVKERLEIRKQDVERKGKYSPGYISGIVLERIFERKTDGLHRSGIDLHI